MKILVKRISMAKYRQMLTHLGGRVERVNVPSTVRDVSFEGIYIDKHKSEIAVPWPVDRPHEAQEKFAQDHCSGGWPVEFIEKDVNRGNLYIVEGNKTCH